MSFGRCARAHPLGVDLEALKGCVIPSRAFVDLVRGVPVEGSRVLHASCFGFGLGAGANPKPLCMAMGRSGTYRLLMSLIHPFHSRRGGWCCATLGGQAMVLPMSC